MSSSTLPEAIGTVVDLALLCTDLDDNEIAQVRQVAEWIDKQINAQTVTNPLLGGRHIDEMTDCRHPHHDAGAPSGCPACKGLLVSWEPRGGWSYRAGHVPTIDLPDTPEPPPTLWDYLTTAAA